MSAHLVILIPHGENRGIRPLLPMLQHGADMGAVAAVNTGFRNIGYKNPSLSDTIFMAPRGQPLAQAPQPVQCSLGAR